MTKFSLSKFYNMYFQAEPNDYSVQHFLTRNCLNYFQRDWPGLLKYIVQSLWRKGELLILYLCHNKMTAVKLLIVFLQFAPRCVKKLNRWLRMCADSYDHFASMTLNPVQTLKKRNPYLWAQHYLSFTWHSRGFPCRLAQSLPTLYDDLFTWHGI